MQSFAGAQNCLARRNGVANITKSGVAPRISRTRAARVQAVVQAPAAEVQAAQSPVKLPSTHLESSKKALEQLKATAVNRECTVILFRVLRKAILFPSGARPCMQRV